MASGRSLGAGAALVVTAVLAFGGAIAPAAAATADVTTPGWVWEGVNDANADIDDAFASYEDLLGDGVVTTGWTEDAFDDILDTGPAYATWSVPDGELYGDWVYLDLQNVSVSQDGRTIVVGRSGLALPGQAEEVTVDVTVTLEIAGSFARWTVDTSSSAPLPGDFQIHFEGNIGADSDSVFLADGSAVVSHDGPKWDPIIGYQTAGNGSLITGTYNNADNTLFAAVGAGRSSLTVALLDYAPCAAAAALEKMQALAPTLVDSFGQTIEPVYSGGDCASLPARLELSGPVTGVIPVAIPDAVSSYFTETAVAVVLEAPEGVDVGLDGLLASDEPTISLEGPALEPGSYPVTVAVVQEGVDGYFEPHYLTTTIVIAEGSPELDDDAPELAATGAVDTVVPLGLGAAALLVGLGFAALRRTAVRR